MENSLVLVTATAGIAFSLLVVPLLLSDPQGDRRANRFLAVFVGILALKLTQRVLLYSGTLEVYPALTGFGRFMYFALAPLLYFYICALTKESFVLEKRQYWHFLPVLLALVSLLPVYFLGEEAKRELAVNYVETIPGNVDILTILDNAGDYTTVVYIHLALNIALPLHLMLYSALGLNQVRLHGQSIGERFSNIDRIQLRWIRVLCYIVLLLCLASLTWFLLFTLGRAEEMDSLPELVTVMLIYCIGLKSLRQPRVYVDNDGSGSGQGVVTDFAAGGRNRPHQKYESSGLSEGDSERLWQNLQEYMAREKPYLIPSLTIAQLSEAMDVHAAHLSQVINTHSKSNFFDFVNRYRVEHAKALIRETLQSKTKMLTIALDAGFNSQSTFYAQFKKHCGETPAQYRRLLLDQT